MSFDDSGYHDRWAVPCMDLFGEKRRVLVALSSTHRGSLQLIAPGNTILLDSEGADELANDLKEAAQRLR